MMTSQKQRRRDLRRAQRVVDENRTRMSNLPFAIADLIREVREEAAQKSADAVGLSLKLLRSGADGRDIRLHELDEAYFKRAFLELEKAALRRAKKEAK